MVEWSIPAKNDLKQIHDGVWSFVFFIRFYDVNIKIVIWQYQSFCVGSCNST